MEKDLQQKPSNVIKIAFVGPESTGKTSLSNALAEIFDTVWIKEYARDYLQEKWDKSQKTCEPHDLLPIAKGQIGLENKAIDLANKFLFCDTNLFVTYVYSKIYYQSADEWLKKCAKDHDYDLFFLTDIDVPWTKDDLRDAPNNRQEHLEIFEKYLIKFNKPFIKVSGLLNERIDFIKNVLEDFDYAKKLKINSLDFCFLHQQGLLLKNLNIHLEKIKNENTHVKLNRIATIGDGISNISDEETNNYAKLFDEKKRKLSVSKFIPSSGAATRMFQFLQEFIHDFDYNKETLNNYINRKKAKNLNLFFLTLNKFPFYENLMSKIRETNKDYDNYDKNIRAYLIIDYLISSNGLNFAALPKAVIPFHQVDKSILTPLETHLNDFSALVSNDQNNEIHFTISENHEFLFDKLFNKFLNEKSINFKLTKSYQKNFTNTIAFSKDFNPLKIEDKFIIRPSGHGALIENLNDIESDLVFIQNIDNVTLHNKNDINQLKKALAGFLLTIQAELFDMQKQFAEQIFDDDLANRLKDFLLKTFYIDFDDLFDGLKTEFKKEVLKKLLFKPIRVCGMVRNEGEAGGGPFWVENDKGYLELQIIESSQINLKDEKQARILNEATHFNPVDLVCGIKDYQGNKYNLLNFIDENTGFIVKKSINGKEFIAYELPGLWNGAMSKWHTIFVDVPLFTFNPVKSVIDLLKPNHQEHVFEI